MYQLQNQTIENRELVITNNQVNYLGHNLTLKNCRLILRTRARNLILARTKFIDCHIEVRQELINFRWMSAWIQGCSFTGKMRGNDFGHWDPPYDPMGGIQDCDFSEALLDGCRFIGCQLRSMKLPHWPCFTVREPRKNNVRFASITSPYDLSFLAHPLYPDPEEETACVYYAPTFMKSYAPKAVREAGKTEDDLKAALQNLEFVLL